MWQSIKSVAVRRLGWDKIRLRQESQSAVTIYSFTKYAWNRVYVLDIESRSFLQYRFPTAPGPWASLHNPSLL